MFLDKCDVLIKHILMIFLILILNYHNILFYR